MHLLEEPFLISGLLPQQKHHDRSWNSYSVIVSAPARAVGEHLLWRQDYFRLGKLGPWTVQPANPGIQVCPMLDSRIDGHFILISSSKWRTERVVWVLTILMKCQKNKLNSRLRLGGILQFIFKIQLECTWNIRIKLCFDHVYCKMGN